MLQAYVDGYAALDAGAVKRVFASVQEATLRQAFSEMRAYQAQIQDQQIVISGTTATVSGTWAAVITNRGGRTQRLSPKIALRLQKSGDTWIIVDRR